MSKPRVLLYADVNLNLIDGSSVWTASVADALVGAGAEVVILPKVAIHDHRVLAPLLDRSEVQIADPDAEGLTSDGVTPRPQDVAATIESLDERVRATAILVRGTAVCDALARSRVGGSGRLWCYLLDIPQAITEAEPKRVAELNRIASWAGKLLCQTEQLRGLVEKLIPAAIGKTALLLSIVPDEAYQARGEEKLKEGPLSLVYSGKFAARWQTLEMCALPSDLRRAGVEARLCMLGDKIHNEPDNPGFLDRMRAALTDSYGVEWLGGLTRSATLERVRSADVALAWRDPEIEASLELSTKLLEFGACGVPAVLNRTPIHEALLGHDYPLFVSSYGDVLDALVRVEREPETAKVAADRLRQAAAEFSRDKAVGRLRTLLDETSRGSTKLGWSGGTDHTLLVAGHDLKFVRSVAEFLDKHHDTTVVFDEWQSTAGHDSAASQELLSKADVIFCEWMTGSAVWYSRNKRPGQRLVVRFHRFEIETDYPAMVDVEAVDAIIFISHEMARQAQKKFGLPVEKSIVIQNAVDTATFARSKERGREYVLGMIGVLPRLKRLDLAIELLRELRTFDARFRLCIKSKAPWELPWLWGRREERDYFERVLEELSGDLDLVDAVVFDEAGPDVAEWLRRVGWIVSVSDLEGSHVAVSEGMASGAVPLVRSWRGAEEVYDQGWLHGNVGSMARMVRETLAAGSYDELARLAQVQAGQFDLPDVAYAIASVLAGGDPGATRRASDSRRSAGRGRSAG